MTIRKQCFGGFNRALAHTSRQTQGRQNPKLEKVSGMKVLVVDNF